jgi:hypothetical protein
MALAAPEDVQSRLGRDLTTSEQTSIPFLLDGASEIIAATVDWTVAQIEAINPAPAILKFVAVELVLRALSNPTGVQSVNETLGSYSYAARYRDAGLELTESEERRVRAALRGTAPSGSVRIESIVDDVLEHRYGS